MGRWAPYPLPIRSYPLWSELTSLTIQKLSEQCQSLQSMYTMKTITTTINPLNKPRLSWVSFHSTQFRKFRLVHQIGTDHFGENCCTQYHSFVFCLQEQKPNARWFCSGLCNRNAQVHWACGMSQLLNRWIVAPWYYLTCCDRRLERLRLIAYV